MRNELLIVHRINVAAFSMERNRGLDSEHVLTSFGLTERKRTNAGWVLLLSRDTRARIHTLLRRYALEIDTSVNREGCSLCSDLKNLPSGASESTAEPQKSVPPGGPKIEGREHGELGALKTG